MLGTNIEDQSSKTLAGTIDGRKQAGFLVGWFIFACLTLITAIDTLSNSGLWLNSELLTINNIDLQGLLFKFGANFTFEPAF